MRQWRTRRPNKSETAACPWLPLQRWCMRTLMATMATPELPIVSPPRSYSRRTGQTTLMFSSTISPRIFSGFAFNGNRINTRKLITPWYFVQQYSLLFRRTMASGGSESNGDKHKHTNRLVNSMSPYLLQHKHNPVDWWEMYFICTPEGVVSYVKL